MFTLQKGLIAICIMIRFTLFLQIYARILTMVRIFYSV